MRKQFRAILASVLSTVVSLCAIQDRALGQANNTSVAGKVMSGEIIVIFPESTTQATVVQIASNLGCEIIQPLAYTPGGYLLGLKGRRAGVVALPDSQLTQAVASLKLMPGVNASPNYMHEKRGQVKTAKATAPFRSRVTEPPGSEFIPNDPSFLTNQQWDMRMMRMPEAWAVQSGDGTPIKIAVIDSGVDTRHPDFTLADGSSIIVDSQAFAGTTGATVDPDGHGTHVAGTMAAATNNRIGVVGVAGLRRNGVNVQLMTMRIGDDTGGLSSAGSLQALNYIRLNGARVVNMSYGGPLQSGDPEVVAVTAAIAAGVVVVGASGNNGQDLATSPDFPTDIPGVIKVNAVGPDRALASYSNYGGPNKKIIAAPGGDDGVTVFSTLPTSQGSYGGQQGTSMAAPHVAGAVGVLLAAGVLPDEVYPLIANTASAPNPPPGQSQLADRYGPGIIDLYSALQQLAPSPTINFDTASSSGGSSGVNGSDRGISYFGATPITISLRAVGRIYANAPAGLRGKWSLEDDLTVEIQSVSRTPSIIKSFVGGRNVLGQPNRIEIPRLSASDNESRRFDGVTVPARNVDGTYTPISLSPGQYKIVMKLNIRENGAIVSVQEQSQFLTIVEKRLSAGRSMFSVPFKAGTFIRPITDPNLTPEAALLGKNTVFSLARYNPLRTPSDDDYARFRNTVDAFNLRSASRFDIQDQLNSRIISYDTTLLSSSVAPIGFGYWLDLDRATTVSTTLLPYPSQIPGVSPIAENAIGINAYATGGGWNMIGAPFTYPVDWSVVTVVVDGVSYSMAEAVRAGYLSPALIGYANGDYVYAIAPSGQLEPFNGYWVRVFRDCTLLVPPVPSASSRRQVVGANADGWKARLIASVAGDVDGQNYFGQLRSATDAEDKNDILKPPAGAGHAYVRFNSTSADGKSRALAFDMRALNGNTVSHQEWTADVATDRANATVVLSWDGIRSAPRNSRLTLRDTVTGERIVMGSRSSYTYRSGEAGSSRKFVISLDPQTSGGSLAIRNMRTVQSGGRAASGWSVRFNTNVDAEIQGAIETLDGRPVGDLIGTGRSQSGAETTLRWDGRNKNGGLVAAGPYVVRVKARTADGQTQVEQRVIQIVR